MKYLRCFALAGLLAHSTSGLAARCAGGVVCDDATKRKVDVIQGYDGCYLAGKWWSFTDGDYAAAAQSMGPKQTQCANTVPPRYWTWSYEGPGNVFFPIPSAELGTSSAAVRFNWNAKSVDAYNNVSYSLLDSTLHAYCAGAGAMMGDDGACYCPVPYSWDANTNQCISVVDKVITRPPRCEFKTENPLYPLNGKKTLKFDLGVMIGREELTLRYDTLRYLPITGATRLINGSFASADRLPRALDGLWFTQLNKRINIQRPKSGGYPWSVRVLREDGQWITFTRTNATTYNALTSDTVETLVPELISGSPTNRLFFTDKYGNVETYDSYGIGTAVVADLTRVDYVGGGYLAFTYRGGMLSRVTDDSGRVLTLHYDEASRLTSITAPDGRSVIFAYDIRGMLASVTWPDGAVRQFLHENVAFPWAVTGVVDENAARLFSFAYDAQGRAIDSQYANGAMHYSVLQNTPSTVNVSESWDAPSRTLTRTYVLSGADSAVLTLPDGGTDAISGITINGQALATSQTQPAGSGCAASNNASSYDANGNVVSRDDFQGQRTCYAYDSSNRETVRVEGLANTVDCSTVTPAGAGLPTGARKITTAWHPDWRFPTQVNQPLHRTTTIYHGQPDPFNNNAAASCIGAANLPNGKPLPVVCKQVGQAMLSSGGVDPAVAANVTTYTYDIGGRVLSSTDANNRTTNYGYHSDMVFSGNPPGSYDPDYDLVTFLLHGNGADGSTTIVDNSASQRAVTLVGNSKISTTQSVFGGSSIAFDGAGDYLSIPYSTDFAFGSGDFTIETFLYKIANNANGTRVWHVNGDYYDGVVLYIEPNGDFGAYVSTNGGGWTYSLPVVANLANGQWYHLAVTRSGGSIFAFVNGVKYTVTTALGTSALYSNPNYPHVIGGQSGANRALNGYIDEFRITKGKARYTDSFTPPTQELLSHGLIFSPSDIGHTVGDLQSITNPAGHVTQFTQYDRAGRVRQMIDPKGVVTDISYTPRGWVSSVTTTAPGGTPRVTSYSYDGVGQLTGVTQPDGTTLSYSYDAAHRLVGVTDAKGNSVNYTLDNVGNRISEEIKDPTGILQRSIGRSFDALNRLQQVTGATR